MNRCISGGILLVSLFFAALSGWSVSNPTPTPGDIVWSYASGYTNLADFAVSKDGRVYLGFSETTYEPVYQEAGYYTPVANRTNQLLALNHVGTLNWQTSEAGQFLSVLGDGRVLSSYSDFNYRFVEYPSGGGSYGLRVTNTFYVFYQGGSEWCPSRIGSYAAITADNHFIVGNIPTDPSNWYSPNIARIDGEANTNVWQQSTVKLTGASPVISSDGSLYLTSWGSTEPIVLPSGYVQPSPFPPPALYAFTEAGSPKWSMANNDTGFLVPSIGSDGTLYVASHQSITNRTENFVVINVEDKYRFNAISPAGVVKWSLEKPDAFGLAAIGATNNIYVCTGSKLLALTSAGEERWTYDAGVPMNLCPALAADGTVYVATQPGKLLAINSDTGSSEWEHDFSKPIYHSPVIGTNGNIYLLVDRADMVVLAGTAEAASTAWPMERHDAQRTGRTTQASTKAITVTEEGKFSLTLSVEPGKTYKVEASEDFETWVEIGTFTSNSAAKDFLDETSADKPQRFYRLVVP